MTLVLESMVKRTSAAFIAVLTVLYRPLHIVVDYNNCLLISSKGFLLAPQHTSRDRVSRRSVQLAVSIRV